jgi:hypothetical protein
MYYNLIVLELNIVATMAYLSDRVIQIKCDIKLGLSIELGDKNELILEKIYPYALRYKALF